MCEKVVHLFQMKDNLNNFQLMQNSVLRMLNVQNLFTNLIQHCNDQAPLMDHRVHLIKCIIKEYIKVRLHYIASKAVNNANNKRT